MDPLPVQVVFASDPQGSSIQHCEMIKQTSVGFVLPSERMLGGEQGENRLH